MTTLAVMRTPTTIRDQEYDRSPLRAEEIEAFDDVAARRGGGACGFDIFEWPRLMVLARI